MSNNPLLQAWTGPLGGVPPFEAIRVEHFLPAMEQAMADQRAEAISIRSCAEPATFDNTLVPLERMGATLKRVEAMYHLWSSNLSTPEFREVRLALEPKRAELRDLIYQDATLFLRVQQVSEQEGLEPEQQRLCALYLRDFRRAGAHLGAEARERVLAINQRLATLYTLFSDRLLEDEENYVTYLGADQLGGLSPDFVAAASAAAAELGKPGQYAITNTRSSVEPFLAYSEERGLRETVWRTFYKRGDNNDANDTKGLITEILSLRLERAKLLGYDSHAHLQLANTMAESPEAAMDLMRQVWSAAVTKFEAEVADLQAFADQRGDGITIAPWDVRYYTELLRAERFTLDPAEVQAHYQLEELVKGMFWAATENFGWQFTELDLPTFHPDVRVWQVDNADGTPRGLFYLDPFARKGKRSGAWMTAYRVQQELDGHLPLISNNCNYQKGKPTLLTADEAETLFHEFGHGLHGLSSAVTFPSLAGTAVPRDFVEFPSQLNEHWVKTPELLGRFALHKETRAPLPMALLERIQQAANLDSGFTTMEFLASAVMDMEMHLCQDPIDPAAFEDEVLERWGLPSQVVMRHRTPQFAHVFSGDWYSAGYYSYLWADVLTADAAEAFAETSFYDKQTAARLMDTVLSRGNTVPPRQAYRNFRGRDPQVDALLRDRGLVA